MHYIFGRVISWQLRPFLFFRVEVGMWTFFVSTERSFILSIQQYPRHP
jgi:hypothetical protein